MMMPATLTEQPPTFAELAKRFGSIPARRFRLDRYPATEADVEELEAREDRLYELVDGILVEKEMAYLESVLAVAVARHLGNFVAGKKIGIVSGADGMMKLFPGLVRIPDAAFAGKDQFPKGRVERIAVPKLYPDLAVEVLSDSNTEEEMDEKLGDYFASGSRLVWIIDPPTQTAMVYTRSEDSLELSETLTIDDTLDGGEVLPGFQLTMKQLFGELEL
jgi:Uma2 family endonuclease